MESSLLGGLRHAIAQHWWVLLLRGLVYIALGLMAFFRQVSRSRRSSC